MSGLCRGFTIRLNYASMGYRYTIAYAGHVVYECPTVYQSDAEGMSAAYAWLSVKYETMLAGLRRVEMTDEDYRLSDLYLSNSDLLSVVDKLVAALQYAARPYMSDDPTARDIWLMADDIHCWVILAASNRLFEEYRAIKKALDDEQSLTSM